MTMDEKNVPLVDILRFIMHSPEHLKVDVLARMQEQLEEHAKVNNLVREVCEDRTTYPKEYENVYGDFDHSRQYLPQVSFRNLAKKNPNLTAAIGPGIYMVLPTDPVTIGLLSWLGATAYKSQDWENQTIMAGYDYNAGRKLDRRSFLKFIACESIPIGLIGSLVGGVMSCVSDIALRDLERRARELQRYQEFCRIEKMLEGYP